MKNITVITRVKFMIKNKSNKKNIFLVVSLIFLFLTGCGSESLFESMKDNTLEVRIKGTYASNSPRDWTPPATAAGFKDLNSVYERDVPGTDPVPTTFRMDIAEMQMADANEENVAHFANYRQDVVFKLNGSGTGISITNENGIVLENDDVVPGVDYRYIYIYVRKMLVDGAVNYKYGADGWEADPDSDHPGDVNPLYYDVFFENSIPSLNFNRWQVNTYWDSLQTSTYSTSVIRTFPIKIPIVGGLIFNRNDSKTVLEVRLVINNFIKKYEKEYSSSGVRKLVQFYAFSDWLRDVHPGENAMAGNVLAVARSYVEGETGTITGNPGGAGYVIAIPLNAVTDKDGVNPSDIANYYREDDERPRNLSADCDFPVTPSLSGSGIEDYLTYYARYENYKSVWQGRFAACDALPAAEVSEDYSTKWNAYRTSADTFRVAPLATYTDGAPYTIKNVKPGRYKVYRFAAPAYGSLFDAVLPALSGDYEVTAGE